MTLRRSRLVPHAIALSLALAALGARAGAQEQQPPATPADDAVRIGARGALYFPNDAQVRDAFGSTIPVLGVVAALPLRPGTTLLYPSIEAAGARAGREHFYAFPLMLVAEHQFATTRASWIPYARAGAGAAYFDYRIARGGAAADTASARRVGAAGNVEVGVIANRWLRGGVGYRLYQRLDGFQLGGVELGIVVGALRLF